MCVRVYVSYVISEILPSLADLLHSEAMFSLSFSRAICNKENSVCGVLVRHIVFLVSDFLSFLT